MRYVIALVALLAAGAVSADNLPGKVFAYECAQVSPERDGFSCTLNATETEVRMKIHFVRKAADLPKEQRAAQEYKYNALLLRYLDLGGTLWDVTAKFWPEGTGLHCYAGKVRYSTHCDNYGS